MFITISSIDPVVQRVPASTYLKNSKKLYELRQAVMLMTALSVREVLDFATYINFNEPFYTSTGPSLVIKSHIEQQLLNIEAFHVFLIRGQIA